MATLKSAGPHRTAIFACLVAAGFTQALNYRMHAPTRLRRAHCRMSADAGAPSSDGESLASRWRVMRNENGGLLLAAAGPQWQEELVDVVVERSAERPGLGLLLTEYLATDDAGLVLVDGLQPEGNAAVAASAPIQPGDAIIAVGEADGGDGTGASAEMVSVEGVTYDTLVGAIGEVPAASPIRVLLKRLTKRPTVQLTLKFPQAEQRDDELITLYPGAPLRRSILAQGQRHARALFAAHACRFRSFGIMCGKTRDATWRIASPAARAFSAHACCSEPCIARHAMQPGSQPAPARAFFCIH